MEVDGIEYPLDKCQRRLDSSLQKGQMERAKKWMERIDAAEIVQVIAEMDKENMTKLVEMANCDIGISKRRYKFT
jgi:predicted Zn-dependent protease